MSTEKTLLYLLAALTAVVMLCLFAACENHGNINITLISDVTEKPQTVSSNDAVSTAAPITSYIASGPNSDAVISFEIITTDENKPMTNPVISTASSDIETAAVKPVTEKTVPVTTVKTSVTTTPITTVPVTTAKAEAAPTDASAIVGWISQKTTLCADENLETAAGEIDAGIGVVLLEKSENVCLVAALGGKYYISADDFTDVRPEADETLMTEKGGIYYKGIKETVVIDAGHQNTAMNDKEPLGPGSSEMKAMLASGTQGITTGTPEYKLNLAVALKLRNELIARGYTVVMIRETNNVSLSNAERAKIANAYNADAFLRIHANGSKDGNVNGAETICMTSNNAFNAELYADSRKLSEAILEKYCRKTGIKEDPIWETDSMTGINWSEVPVTILEMGYMSNKSDDRLMATDAFKINAAIGIADGLDLYFENRKQ